MPYKNEDGTIPSGLSINVMRQCMENKELLENRDDTYVGTGTVSTDGVAITQPFRLEDYHYITSYKGGEHSGVIQSNPYIVNENFERYVYVTILTLLDENTAQYSSLEHYIGIREPKYPGAEYPIDDLMMPYYHIQDTESLRSTIQRYKHEYPDGEVYAFDTINSRTTYYRDNNGIRTVECDDDDEIITALERSIYYDQSSANLYKKIATDRVYEMSVENTILAKESEQFSSLKGMLGVMGTKDNLHDMYIEWQENRSYGSYFLYAGLLRFDHLRLFTINKINSTEIFSDQKTYFVLNYGGGCNKILYTSQQFTEAKNKNYDIYTMPKYNNNNLYFISSYNYNDSEFLTIRGINYEFLDTYSDYDFIRKVVAKEPVSFEGVTFGYFSSDFKDSTYISLGYSTLHNSATLNGKLQFESSESGEEYGASSGGWNGGPPRFLGYQTRYIIVGMHDFTDFPNRKHIFHFRQIKKILWNTKNPVDLVSEQSADSAHYMIIFKIIERNTTE